MTDDEIVTLGSFLRDPHACGVLVEQYEQQIFQHFMTTPPHEQKKRDGIYAAFQGTQDFLTHMKALVEQKDKLVQPPTGRRSITNSLGQLMIAKDDDLTYVQVTCLACAQAHPTIFHTARRGHAEPSPFQALLRSRGRGSIS